MRAQAGRKAESRPHGVAILTVISWLDFAKAAAAHQLLAARNAQRGQDEDGDGLAAGHDAGDLRSILAGRDANLALLFEGIAFDTLLYPN